MNSTPEEFRRGLILGIAILAVFGLILLAASHSEPPVDEGNDTLLKVYGPIGGGN